MRHTFRLFLKRYPIRLAKAGCKVKMDTVWLAGVTKAHLCYVSGMTLEGSGRTTIDGMEYLYDVFQTPDGTFFSVLGWPGYLDTYKRLDLLTKPEESVLGWTGYLDALSTKPEEVCGEKN